MKDTLVFDIETSNFFSDPEVGWHNYDALKISALGVYSYLRDEYVCFGEHELVHAAELFRNAETIVGFCINRYDVPVLNVAFRALRVSPPINLYANTRIDLLEEIERVTGHRVSLNSLAKANLGTEKIGTGKQAVELYREGKTEELKKYCLKDVEITKALYDLYRERKQLLIPRKRGGESVEVVFHPAVQGTL